MTATSYVRLVDTMANVRGVRAAVVAWEAEGIVVESMAHADVPLDALAAFGCALSRRARQAVLRSGLGETRFVAADAEFGRICAVARHELVMLVLTDRDANTGLIRMALLRAAEELA